MKESSSVTDDGEHVTSVELVPSSVVLPPNKTNVLPAGLLLTKCDLVGKDVVTVTNVLSKININDNVEVNYCFYFMHEIYDF